MSQPPSTIGYGQQTPYGAGFAPSSAVRQSMDSSGTRMRLLGVLMGLWAFINLISFAFLDTFLSAYIAYRLFNSAVDPRSSPAAIREAGESATQAKATLIGYAVLYAIRIAVTFLVPDVYDIYCTGVGPELCDQVLITDIVVSMLCCGVCIVCASGHEDNVAMVVLESGGAPDSGYQQHPSSSPQTTTPPPPSYTPESNGTDVYPNAEASEKPYDYGAAPAL